MAARYGITTIVEPQNSLDDLALFARARAEGQMRSWVPEETVETTTALRAYTWGGAYSVFAEHDRGTQEVGKYADLAVLSRDLFEAAPTDVLDTTVELTVVEGEVVHRAA